MGAPRRVGGSLLDLDIEEVETLAVTPDLNDDFPVNHRAYDIIYRVSKPIDPHQTPIHPQLKPILVEVQSTQDTVKLLVS